MTAHVLSQDRRLYDRIRRRLHGMLLLPFSVLAALIVGAVAFVAYVLWPTWPSASVPLDAPEIPVTVAGVLFDVPPAAIRFAVQRHPGPHERVDLALLWPSLSPPRDTKVADLPAGQGENGGPAADATQRLFITIAALGKLLPPAERLRTIYPRYVEGEATLGPEGLAILPFRAGTPYAGEDLVYFADDADQFYARCTRQAGIVPGTCIHERAVDGADVTLRFPRAWINDWRGAAAGFDRLMAQLHPK